MFNIFKNATGLFTYSDSVRTLNTNTPPKQHISRESDDVYLRKTVTPPVRFHTEMETTYAADKYNGRYDRWDIHYNGHKLDGRAINDIVVEANFDSLSGEHITPSGYVCDGFVVDETLELSDECVSSDDTDDESFKTITRDQMADEHELSSSDDSDDSDSSYYDSMSSENDEDLSTVDSDEDYE